MPSYFLIYKIKEKEEERRKNFKEREQEKK
jgi:hypothetical protein